MAVRSKSKLNSSDKCRRSPLRLRFIDARASFSKIHLDLRCRGGEMQSLRVATGHCRRRGTLRTRSPRRPQPPSGSPGLDWLVRQETESGMTRDHGSPRLRAWCRLVRDVAEPARAAAKRRHRDSLRRQRPRPAGLWPRDRRPYESRWRPPTQCGLAFSPSHLSGHSVPFGAGRSDPVVAGKGQVRRRER
jgi:hypothetical protein